jgi:hypothetical protein
MSTSYDQRPTLEDRVRASRLIVIGRVESVELLARERIGQMEEQQAIAHIAIERVVRGDSEARRVGVRFIVPGDRRARPGAQAIREGERLILFLVPDVGPGARPNTFVAYLRGHYELTKADAFVVDRRRVGLKALGELVRTVENADAAETQSWARYERELVERAELPPVTEVPEPLMGAGPLPDRPAKGAQPGTRRGGRRPPRKGPASKP